MVRYAVLFRSADIGNTSSRGIVSDYNKWLENHPESEPLFVTSLEGGHDWLLLVTFQGPKEDAQEARSLSKR